jgi:predicted metalloprotease with PDZ domain
VVDIQPPEGEAYASWRVATSLPELKARRHRFGSYIAQDYDELIDHPVEMGEFSLIKFEAHGVPHEMAITGRVPNLDTERLANDLQRICEHQIALFEPRTKRAPMSRYVFLTLAVGDGYGGLEHRASTALICARSDLPVQGQATMSDGYRSFLGLCSHEYFHTWNVKRIKPAVFAPYNLTQENYIDYAMSLQNSLRGFPQPKIPKGVFRFKTHEDADQWLMDHLIRKPAN